MLALLNIGLRQSNKLLHLNFQLYINMSTEATLSLKPYKLYNLDEAPAGETKLTREDALKMYRQMYAIRRIEHKAADLYKSKDIRGFLHLYAGEEAIATGMKAVMRPDDSLVTSYRCHSFAYLNGYSARSILAELMGKLTGCSRGKGGSMHMYGRMFYGGNGIVGAQAPVGTGIAFAYKYRKMDNVCFTLYGDGAANQGQVFEAYNMAKLWSLPVVFVCENNGYAMGTSVSRSSANTSYFTRCEYIPGIWVNAVDVLTVREAVRFALAHCSAGKGPLIMEMSTYRYYGHSMADPGTTYRTREEVADARQNRDPIVLFKTQIVGAGLATDKEFTDINNEVKQEIERAAAEAKKDPEPSLDVLAEDIMVKPLVPKVRGITPWQSHKHKHSNSIINN